MRAEGCRCFLGFGTIWDNSLSFGDNLGQFFRFWDNLGHVFRVWDNLGHFFRSLFGGSEKVQGCRAPSIRFEKVSVLWQGGPRQGPCQAPLGVYVCRAPLRVLCHYLVSGRAV